MAKNRIEFWFKDWDNVYIQLPVNPESIDLESPFTINTVKIASLGDVSIPGERGIKSLTIDSFFPRDYNASYCEYEGFMEPWDFVEKFEKWRDTRKNVRLIISGTPISLPCYIEDFTIEAEKSGAPGDIYYSMTLVEYKPMQAPSEVAGVSILPKTASRAASNVTTPKSHTVVSGESLSLIAKKVYGDMTKWPKIYEANKSAIGKNPDLIKPGQKLVLP